MTASFGGTVRIWDARSGRTLAVLRGHRGVLRGAFGADELSLGEDGTVRVWTCDVCATRLPELPALARERLAAAG